MNANTNTTKKTTTPKTIPKKIMGYLKFAHFVLTSSSDQDQSDILHTLFLDKSIEHIVALVNDVVVNGQQDKIINDLRKLFFTKPKSKSIPKQKSKPVKPNDADLIVNDLVTLARTTEFEHAPTPYTPLKKTRLKKTKASIETPVETPGETTVETPGETPVETLVETPVETLVETPVETTVETPVETLVETPVEITVETLVETLVETPVEITVETPVETLVETLVKKTPVKKTRAKKTKTDYDYSPERPCPTFLPNPYDNKPKNPRAKNNK